MEKTSLKQKSLLIIFGLFLTIVLLEIGLRLAGAVVFYLQERHNHFSFAQNEYRILCLGESTTALGDEDSYPSQLEQILNAPNGQKKFTVINEGIISTTTDYILGHLDQNLDKYKPQMVILMMGINDKIYLLHDPTKSLWQENIKSCLKDLRIYKLAHLLYEHITHRFKEIRNPAKAAEIPSHDENDYQHTENFLKAVIAEFIQRFHDHMAAAAQYRQKGQSPQAQEEEQLGRQSLSAASLTCVQLAHRYRIQGLLQQAQDVLEQATVLKPDSPDVYEEWGELYFDQQKIEQALKAFQAALTLDPHNNDVFLGLARVYHQEHNDNAFFFYAGYLQTKPKDYWARIELAQWLREGKHYGPAEKYLDEAIEIDSTFEQAYLDLGQILDDQGQYQQEEAFYLKEIPLHAQSQRFYQALGQLYEKQGKMDLAKFYFQKATQQDLADYLPITWVNYNLILNKILDRHIKVVVMQYPLRDIVALKKNLGQRNGMVFVENKQNFNQALADHGYWYFFKDNFAYNFGHCTRAGNELIARNLTEVILKNE